MNWTGTWRNQYGSTLTIAEERDGLIKGLFRTALQDSAFFGRELQVTGICRGDCINFAFGISDEPSTSICSFTGMLRDEKLETVWHVVTSRKAEAGQPTQKLGWAHSVQTNADTFERVLEAR